MFLLILSSATRTYGIYGFRFVCLSLVLLGSNALQCLQCLGEVVPGKVYRMVCMDRFRPECRGADEVFEGCGSMREKLVKVSSFWVFSSILFEGCCTEVNIQWGRF